MGFAVPLEWLRAAAGGVLIGLAAGGLRLATGEIAGISGIARGALAGPDRRWRVAFLAGLVAAGLAALLTVGTAPAAGLGQTPFPCLGLAGLLVGWGAGLANGCTSGHGVCGLARLSPRSLAAVPVFMATAAITVFLLRHGFAR
jgi:uncharacterized membrane protein YedE/YeeE